MNQETDCRKQGEKKRKLRVKIFCHAINPLGNPITATDPIG